MKKILLLLLILSGFSVLGQTKVDYISKIKYSYYQNGSVLNTNDLLMAVKGNEQAYKKIKAARDNKIYANLLSIPGGFLIGYPIGTAIAGGAPNWLLAGIGVGIIALTIPISIIANKQISEGVSIYNNSLYEKVSLKQNNNPTFNIGVTQNGIGVVMQF